MARMRRGLRIFFSAASLLLLVLVVAVWVASHWYGLRFDYWTITPVSTYQGTLHIVKLSVNSGRFCGTSYACKLYEEYEDFDPSSGSAQQLRPIVAQRHHRWGHYQISPRSRSDWNFRIAHEYKVAKVPDGQQIVYEDTYHLLGFMIQYFDNPREGGWYGAVPCYFVAGVLTAPLWLWARRLWNARRRRRRIERGLCLDCGYDLRASHEQCPECGRTIDVGDEKRLTLAAKQA